MKRALAFLLIFSGLTIICYPSGKNLYIDYLQQKMIRDWENGENGFLEAKEAINSFSQLTDIFSEALTEAPALAADTSAQEQSVQSDKKTEKKAEAEKPQILGTIEIEKIGVRLPILKGASRENMKYGAGHLTGTDYPGEIGNAAIAAHRSRTFGRMFNRLGELEEDDTIVIKDRNQTFKYTIFNTSIVSPDDTSVLKRNGEDQLLTLITCDPVDKATHRLIIHARLVP
ncbi:hypothetical protein AM500_02045 [Bacillus sp. FJAT-18017]|nr:hypothetical protein AM500_02045 [Bacillus sp. FJAT-18017]